ncbi:hypothetical protein F5B20DRAFT_122714 [Whalleya microplaca]|nr:hypothetical protein F5B20DRAFT_122714 [Whalleya microplaca]
MNAPISSALRSRKSCRLPAWPPSFFDFLCIYLSIGLSSAYVYCLGTNLPTWCCGGRAALTVGYYLRPAIFLVALFRASSEPHPRQGTARHGEARRGGSSMDEREKRPFFLIPKPKIPPPPPLAGTKPREEKFLAYNRTIVLWGVAEEGDDSRKSVGCYRRLRETLHA